MGLWDMGRQSTSREERDIQDKIIFVTGGAQGIGTAVTLACLGEGANVAVLDVDGEAMAALADEADVGGRLMSHALAASLAPDVRVNAISPGWIATETWQKPSRRNEPHLSDEDHAQHWTGRVGNPNDIAGMAVYLLSDRAEFDTGTNVTIDGGMTRKMIYV